MVVIDLGSVRNFRSKKRVTHRLNCQDVSIERVNNRHSAKISGLHKPSIEFYARREEIGATFGGENSVEKMLLLPLLPLPLPLPLSLLAIFSKTRLTSTTAPMLKLRNVSISNVLL